MAQIINSKGWRKTILPLGSTIGQAISCLERSSMKIILVVNENDKLAGTLTDGDIRRAFLKGYRLDSKIDDVIHTNPLVVPPNIDPNILVQLMKKNKIHQFPIIDDFDSIVGLYSLDLITPVEPSENLVVIMAGGKGTRLLPHTENCPKPLLKIADKPILEYIIERLAADGFSNIIISINYLGYMIEDYFGDGNKLNVKIDYIREDIPLGTAGCLSLLPKKPKLPIIVTNGDILTRIDYNAILDFHFKNNAFATMAVLEQEIKNQFGVVRTNGIEITSFEEKPIYKNLVNAGVYVLDPIVLTNINSNTFCDMPTLFELIKNNGGRTIVYPIHESWLDIGRSEDLVKAKMML